jgi:hypothetical protein
MSSIRKSTKRRSGEVDRFGGDSGRFGLRTIGDYGEEKQKSGY